MGSNTAGVAIAAFTCPQCARATEFEQPPCPDGHGQDCPEWYCTECGSASLAGPVTVIHSAPRGGRRAA